MIHNLSYLVNGSSLSLPAHLSACLTASVLAQAGRQAGGFGARATSFHAAHFAKQNTNSVGVRSEGPRATTSCIRDKLRPERGD